MGQKVSRLGFSTHAEKVAAVLDLQRPYAKPALQTFLGMVVYFAAFIPFFSFVAQPLFALLKKGADWEWRAEHEFAWVALKKSLASTPVLAHAQPGQPYRLYTDASDFALGACLQQVQLL